MGIFDIFHEEAKVPAARSDSDSNDAPAGGAITTALEAIWLEKKTPSRDPRRTIVLLTGAIMLSWKVFSAAF